jgi:hypothetical protein
MNRDGCHREFPSVPTQHVMRLPSSVKTEREPWPRS